MNSNRRVQSANIHLIGYCNYRCSFCFSRGLTKEYMKPADWIPVLDYLKSIGVTKINLAGGEPALYPHLEEMVDLLRSYDFTVSIVSNGSRIDDAFLRKYLGRISWLGLSIDSPDESDEIRIGRHCSGIEHIAHVRDIARKASDMGYNVKLNITVTQDSWSKDFRPLIEDIRPRRIKAFRAITIRNANDNSGDNWSITSEQFESFRENHCDVQRMVFEDNDDVIDSYLMFDPIGRWMVNSDGVQYFLPFEQLVREGPDSVLDVNRYYGRGAVYDW